MLQIPSESRVNRHAHVQKKKMLHHNAMPLSHQLVPERHSINPYQHHHPAPFGPNPIPLKMLIGTGSKSQIPPRAKSSTSKGAVKYIHTSTITAFALRRTAFSTCCVTPADLSSWTAVVWTVTPRACIMKNIIGPVRGYVSPSWVWLPVACRTPERKKATHVDINFAPTDRGFRPREATSQSPGC